MAHGPHLPVCCVNLFATQCTREACPFGKARLWRARFLLRRKVPPPWGRCYHAATRHGRSPPSQEAARGHPQLK
ncbi:hypothetical protein RR42_m3970 [Cupriavidus basilensis]|uniref:Uncharacterized protein n=1 Tax=Cupriavidus basilensis TaxID=68895 RepID=A0A0C4YEY8_9BURK|nr:hypothetical protein RR42_m3970 [Cupriavidus basilensis]